MRRSRPVVSWFFRYLSTLGDDLRVVGAVLIEPENGRRGAETRAADGEFHPILHGGILRLAGPADVTAFNVVFQKNTRLRVEG